MLYNHMETLMSRKLLTLSLTATLMGGTAFADAPRVAVDIAPVHSLVARVMDGVGTHDLIIPLGASPHEYSLRPSEAAALQDANLVFWIGSGLTPWLADTIETLAPDANVTELLEADGTIELEFREGALFEAHEDHEEEEHDDHEEEGDDDHADDDHDERHACDTPCATSAAKRRFCYHPKRRDKQRSGSKGQSRAGEREANGAGTCIAQRGRQTRVSSENKSQDEPANNISRQMLREPIAMSIRVLFGTLMMRVLAGSIGHYGYSDHYGRRDYPVQ